MSTSPGIVIGIPTFRRPAPLAALLESLLPQVPPSRALIIVGDNDSGTDAPRVVEAFRVRGLPVRCVPVPERGISQVRNELIRAATRACPQWRLLLMLDDDGVVLPGWFDALVDGADRLATDVVGGPVLGELPTGASLLARNSVYAGRTRHPTGPVPMLNGAQNIAVTRAICDALTDPWFDVTRGISGGEDYHFFRRILAHGGSLGWCDEAQVVEPTPLDRLRWRPLLRRTFTSNVLAARTDVELVGRSKVWNDLRHGAPQVARDTAAGVLRRDPDRIAKAALRVVALAGRAGGLVRAGAQPTHDY